MQASARYLLNEVSGSGSGSFDEYADALVPSRFFVQAQGETPEEAAEFTFRWFNRDDRDNGRHERSCSVGDVIQVAVRQYPAEGLPYWRQHFYVVEPVGFREVGRIAVCAAIRRAGFSFTEARKATEGLYAPTRQAAHEITS